MNEPKLSKKQAAMLVSARNCANNYIDVISPIKDERESRIKDFMAGYFKGLKDVGFDVTDPTTLSGVDIVDMYEQ